jgi:hypothetical protein
MNLNCDTGSLAPSILFASFEEEGEVLEKYITDVNLHGPVMDRSLRSFGISFLARADPGRHRRRLEQLPTVGSLPEMNIMGMAGVWRIF